MSNIFSNYGKLTGNMMASLIDEKGAASDVSGFFDTGSYMLNALISADIFGGLPRNKMLTLASDPGVGKSFIAISILKQFLDNHKDGYVIYYDTESAITSNMLIDRDVDVSRVLYAPVGSVEQFRHESAKFLDSYNAEEGEKPPFIMVLDSIGNLSTEKEYEDAIGGKNSTDLTKARLMKTALRAITYALMKANAPLIATNHIYSEIGQMYPKKVMTGGTAATYTSSSILYLSKRKEKDGGDQVGNIITARAEKSRFTIENSKAELYLHFKKGLNRYYGLLPFAEKAGIFKKVGHRYEVQDGRKLYEKQLYETPKEFFTQEVLEKINNEIQKTFSYGKIESDTVGMSEDVVED